MAQLPLRARLYILAIIIAGTAVGVWHLSRLSGVNLAILLMVTGLAAVAQVLKVEGPTDRSSYNLSWVTYGFAFLLLGPSAALFVILISHLVEWAWHRYAWYIQAFNIATFAACISAAGLLYGWIIASQPPSALVDLLALLAALVTFTLLNHLLIGLVLKLARGQNFAESGVFDRLPLIIDFTLLGMGAAAALIWHYNPFATFLGVIPLYLIYYTLKIPALQRQTQIDAKTGLYNSRYFSNALEGELARAHRFGRPLTVIMADLDLLRNINNSYGHLAGDTVLVGVAHIIKASVRDYDIVARFGGEEFAILMPETAPEQALERIEAVRAAIQAAHFPISTSLTPIQTTMSFGLAGRHRTGQSATDIIHEADMAVYRAKLAGRNRVCLTATVAEAPFGQLPAAPAERAVPPPVVLPATSELPPTEAPRPPAAGPAPTLKARPAWAINVYILALAAVALGLTSLLLKPALPSDGLGLALFATLVLLTEWLALDIYVRDTSVSTAAAPLLAGALLFGPAGVVLLSVFQAGAALVKHRSAPSRFVFNASNQIIANLLICLLIWLLPVPFADLPVWGRVVVALLGAGLAYLSSTLLVAGAMDLSSGQAWRVVWNERFQWLWPFYLALGCVAYALTMVYQGQGVIGVIVVLVPLLMLRVSQNQYISHTQATVDQLRTANAELEHRTAEVSELSEGLILALSQAIDLRDPFVRGHSIHVAQYATLIAAELGLPPGRVEVVRKAGLLHDLGKLGISESILFKPSQLTASEYETIKEHAALGAELARESRALHELAAFIRHHHEHYDGHGYPAGLHGPAIPVESRILSVADAVEAMASDRPYRLGMDVTMILEELQRFAGTQFDPQVVAAFARVLRRQPANLVVNSAREIHVRVPEGAPDSPPEGATRDQVRLAAGSA